MLLLRTETLPDDSSHWEISAEFRRLLSIAFKTAGKLYLRSSNDNDFRGP
jgi:hypothetical protein